MKNRKGGVKIGMRIAVMLLCCGSAPVQADNKSDLWDARMALRAGDLTQVAAKAEALSKDPLGIYPRYWLLSQQMSALSAEHVLPFLRFYQGSLLAEKLRAEWLVSLAKKEDWPQFLTQYALLNDEPSVEIKCYFFRARLVGADINKTAFVLAQAKEEFWFSAKDLPTACNELMAQLMSAGVVSETDLWARLRLALEANAGGMIRYLSAALGQPITPAETTMLQENPSAWLKNPTQSARMQSELMVFAVSRIARSNADAAHAELQKWLPQLSEPMQAYGWRRLAMIAAIRQDPRTLEWFEKSHALPWTDAALEWRIRMALRAQDWNLVSAAISQLSDAKQSERGWQYWQARAFAQKKLPLLANKIFAGLSVGDDFYGLLAQDRLGALIGASGAVYKLTDEDARRVQAHAGLQRALLLNELGLRTEAAREWSWALRGADDRLLLAAADAAHQVGWYDRAIYAADRTKKLHSKALRFLAPYREMTREYSQAQGLDEAWVFGLMRQESRFVSAARSGVGAGGLMQVMPTTAQWVANKMGLNYHAGMLSDAGSNVQLGTYYLKHVLSVLSNQPVLATAAYNAGPNRARAWQAANEPMEAAIYIESIPFSETRDYAKKVMTNAVHYEQVFNGGSQKLTERIGEIPPRNPQIIEGP